MATIYSEGQELKNENSIVNEFEPDQIVCRWDGKVMTYWNGEFNEKGEGIFHTVPRKEKCLPPQELTLVGILAELKKTNQKLDKGFKNTDNQLKSVERQLKSIDKRLTKLEKDM